MLKKVGEVFYHFGIVNPRAYPLFVTSGPGIRPCSFTLNYAFSRHLDTDAWGSEGAAYPPLLGLRLSTRNPFRGILGMAAYFVFRFISFFS